VETPSQKLAQKIIERLIHEKLLTDQQGGKLLPKFFSGKLTQEDWQLAIELSAAQEDKP
jgi:hypothetical protein